MKRNQMTKQGAPALSLRKETLGQLETSDLQGAVGAGVLHVPLGYQDDTTPIYGPG